MLLNWHINSAYPDAEAMLGNLPLAISADSSASIAEQLDATYGWEPLLPNQGWELSLDDMLIYPGLPPASPIAYAYHLGEKIILFPAGFVCIVQLGGAFQLARINQ